MELIYLWIEKFRNLKKEAFNFSSNFEVTVMDDSTINIIRKEKKINLFGEKCSNVNAVMGINGSGKTSVLDLLGVRRDERINFNENDEYFLIYHLKDDVFAIEGNGLHLINNQLINTPLESSRRVTEPYSFTFKLIDKKFEFKNFFQEDKEAHTSIKYISFRYNYDSYTYKSHRSFDTDKDNSHFFQRSNLNIENIGQYGIYKMLVDLNSKKDNSVYNTFNFKSVAKITINLKYNNNKLNDLDSNIDFEMKNFKANLLLKNLINNIQDSQSNLETNKTNFLNKFMYGFSYSLIAYYYFDPSTNSKEFLKDLESKLKEIEIKYGDESKKYFEEIIRYMLEQLKGIKYFSNINDIQSTYDEYLNYLEDLDWKKFRKTYIESPIDDDEDGLVKLIKEIDRVNFNYYDEIKDMLSVFKISYNPLSSGEKALLSLFSALYHGILNFENTNKVILLLDEPEQYLHPEWSRVLLNGLLDFLNDVTFENLDCQLIFTTHSPFMISDLSLKNIFVLDDKTKSSDEKLNETFASNIHTLLSKEFFMKSTIGEFAKKKINEALNILNDEEKNKLKENRDLVNYIISIIGEPLIKKKMEEMRNKIYLDENEISNRIQELEKQIEELKKYDSNN